MSTSTDDYLYDVLGDHHGIHLAPEEMDVIIEASLHLARQRQLKK